MEVSGQSDRKGLNSSPVSGLIFNFNDSSESIHSSDFINKSPVMNRSPVAQIQDEWQRKLYKNKGILTHIKFDRSCLKTYLVLFFIFFKKRLY